MPNHDHDTDAVLASATDSPDIPALVTGLRSLISAHSDLYSRREDARRLRLCEWDGQTPDGRKRGEALGEEPFPYEGATDSRVRLADTVINERKALLVEAAMRSTPQVAGMESGDLERASRLRTLFLWLRDNALADELRRELTLAAEYLLADDPGAALVSVWWHRQLAWDRETLTLEQLTERILGTVPQEQRPAMLTRLRDLAFDPAREEQAIESLATLYPQASRRQLKTALGRWRRGEAAELPKPYMREDRPKIVAHRVFDDVFFPVDEADPERWPWCYFREVYTEPELREKVHSEGWDAAWVDALLEKGKGKTFVTEAMDDREVTANGRRGVPAAALDDSRYEVWRAFVRSVDEDGFPGIWTTVFSPCLPDQFAKHEPSPFRHGRMPVVPFVREWLSRNIRDSRGISALIGTHQHEIKVQRDTRGDYAQLATTPPLLVHMRRAGVQLILAPGAQLPMQRQDDFAYLNPPPYPQASIEHERAVKAEVNDLVARGGPEADPARVALIQGAEVNAWLGSVREVWRQILQLCQQFMSPMQFSRITGGKQEAYVLGREDIQGQFDLRLVYDVRDGDMEFLTTKLDFVGKLAGLDRNGAIDFGTIVRLGMQALDPYLADSAVRDTQAATQAEVKDEQVNLALMVAGVEPQMQEKGQNHQLRMQVLQQAVQQSPVLQAALQQPESPFTKLVQRRMQHLQFMVQQSVNAQTGRVGVQAQ